jgi:hypothetical protein
MEIVYTPNAQDALDVNIYKLLINKRLLLKHRFIYAVYVGAIFCIISYLTKLTSPLIVGGIGMILATVFTPQISIYGIKNSTAKAVLTPEYQTLFTVRRVMLSPEGIKVVTHQKESLWQYDFIKNIDITKNLIHIVFKDSLEFNIPLRVFTTTDEMESFIACLTEKMSLAMKA